MFRRTMALLITIVLLLLPEAREVLADGSTVQDLELVNQQLRGKVAEIELTDGSTIKKAKKVVVEPNFTYWKLNGEEQEVETGQVVRIRARSKSKGLIGLGVGAGAAALAALATSTEECNEIGQCTSITAGDQFGFLVALFAPIGYGVGKAIPRKQKLVYEAQGSPSAEPAEDHTDANRLTP